MSARPRTTAVLAVGLGVAALGYAAFAWTADPAFAPFFFSGLVLAFAAGVALLLATFLPRDAALGAQGWGVLGGGAFLLLVAAVSGFYAYADPMLLVAGLVLLAIYVAVAAVVVLRRRRRAVDA